MLSPVKFLVEQANLVIAPKFLQSGGGELFFPEISH